MNLLFFRMLTRANQDNSPRRCGNCRRCACAKQTHEHEPMFDPEHFEHDVSPLASQTLKFFEELESRNETARNEYWNAFCELNVSAPECKTYEV
ncbi:MAG: hypothetical protein CL959_01780 [Euryarchaeota archaeon]|nr:hypothetical protein [Euryarchaeota archaeon]